MANDLRSNIEVHGNEQVVKKLDELLNQVEYGEILPFAQAFYSDVELGEGGGILNSWSFTNIGAKWTYLTDIAGEGSFSTTSAGYPPIEFFIHLYNTLVEIDPEVFIEVQYEEEGYNTIGAVVIKKDRDGIPCIWEEQDNEIEDPTEDMDWDDEQYDQVQMEFIEMVYKSQLKMLNECHDLINTDGEPIDNYQG